MWLDRLNTSLDVGAKVAILAGALFVGLFLWSHQNAPSIDASLNNGKQEVEALRKVLARDSVHQLERNRALAYIRQQADTIAAWHAAALVLAHRGDSLALLGSWQGAAQAYAQSTAKCEATLMLCQARGDSLFRVVVADSTRIDSLKAAVRPVVATVDTLAQEADCHLVHVGFVKLVRCPGPLTSFKLGGLFGAGLLEVLRKLVTGGL